MAAAVTTATCTVLAAAWAVYTAICAALSYLARGVLTIIMITLCG